MLFLTKRRALRIPTPPTMVNHRNYVVSLSQLGRLLGRGGGGRSARRSCRRRRREKLLVDGGRVVGVRTGDKGAAARARSSPNFEPGSDITARVTILAEGTQGHLTGAALERFGLRGDEPAGVGARREGGLEGRASRCDRVIHTMGWPLRPGRKYREFGGSFVYPMGDDMVTIGMVVGLDYRDAELSVHDLLQELKTHPRIRRILEGGERVQWGAKTIPGGRVRRAAEAVPRAGPAAVRATASGS